jgi:glycosyltransferase involved in cell wall biosynthesis
VRSLQIVADGAPGGGTTHVLQLLRKFGNEYSLGLATQARSYLSKEARSLGIECFELDFFRGALEARIPLDLLRILGCFKPHVVHVHGSRAGFFYSLAAARTPMVYTVHGYHFPHKRSPLVRWFALNAERMVSRRADHIIFVSNSDAEVAQAHKFLKGSKRYAVIYNSIPLARIPKARPRELKHVGFIGRLEYQKDPLLFVKVVAHLPGYGATIVGAGAFENEVRSEIERLELSGRVRVLGMLPHRRTLEELSKLGTIVMTSRWEGLPHIPLEAMASGVPVVATNVGGLSEIVESEQSGLLVNSRSADELARAVVRLTEDMALRERIIRNARNRVHELFSEDVMCRKISEIYRQAAIL